MNKEIKLIIEKNLPAQVGTVLKEALAKAESDAVALEESKKALVNLKEFNRSIEERLNAHGKLDAREVSVTAREVAVEKKEVRQEVDILTIKLEESEKRADAVTDFTTGLVRNTIFRKSILDSETPGAYQNPDGSWTYPAATNKSLTETKEKE